MAIVYSRFLTSELKNLLAIKFLLVLQILFYQCAIEFLCENTVINVKRSQSFERLLFSLTCANGKLSSRAKMCSSFVNVVFVAEVYVLLNLCLK